MFPAWMIPMFKQVGINAVKNAATGQNLLDGAEFAAISGGIQGAVNPASAKNVSGVGSAPSGVSGVGSAPSGAIGGVPASGTIESVMGKANASGTFTNPDYYANILGNQVYTGGEGLLSNAMGNIGNSLGEYATPQNLIGVSNLLSNMNQAQPMPSAGGGVRGGGAVKLEPFVTGQVYTKKKRGNA